MNQTSSLLPQRGVISLTGADTVPFLQGLVSNDVTRATADQAVYAAQLTPQGRYLHDMFILAKGDELWLDCAAVHADALIAKLNKYKLRSTVMVHDRRSTHGVAVGDTADFLSFGDPRHPALPARSILPRGSLPAADATYLAAYERQRLEIGVPDGEHDLIVGETLLLEANFDYLHGVDFHKGCYLGQEMTARTHFRKLIKRRLVPVLCQNGACPPTGTPLMATGQAVGIMRSSLDALGLALLNLSTIITGAEVSAGERVLLPHRPDWLPAEVMVIGA